MKNKFILIMLFKSIVIVFTFLSIFVLLNACENSQPPSSSLITIDKSKSFFSDFEIRDDKVYILCNVVIKNTFSIEKEIKLNAIFNDDKESGLLKEALLAGYKDDFETDIFCVNSGETIIKVFFVGDWGGNRIKHDRNLPDINITIIQD